MVTCTSAPFLPQPGKVIYGQGVPNLGAVLTSELTPVPHGHSRGGACVDMGPRRPLGAGTGFSSSGTASLLPWYCPRGPAAACIDFLWFRFFKAS